MRRYSRRARYWALVTVHAYSDRIVIRQYGEVVAAHRKWPTSSARY
jgi:hypothetical protein